MTTNRWQLLLILFLSVNLSLGTGIKINDLTLEVQDGKHVAVGANTNKPAICWCAEVYSPHIDMTTGADGYYHIGSFGNVTAGNRSYMVFCANRDDLADSEIIWANVTVQKWKFSQNFLFSFLSKM